MPKTFKELLGTRVLVADGAMGTMLQSFGELSLEEDFQNLEGCNEVLNTTRPDIVREVHRAYLEAGSDCIETNSFGTNLAALNEYGIVDRLAIIEPRPADPESDLDEYIHLGESKRSRLHDDGDALWCSPFEPEDDDEPNTLDSSQVNWRCIDEIDWQAEKAKDDRAMAIGDPQPGNTVDVLDQARQVLDDIEKYGGALPY